MADANSKNSVYNSRVGRYVNGGTTEVSSWALEIWIKNPPIRDASDIVYFVEKIYESQPRRLGMLFYGDEELWWVICQYNGILDPFAELVEGKLLLVPLLDRVKADLFTANPKVGGTPSTRVV